MAGRRRPGRPPKDRSFDDLDAGLRAEILAAIDSAADEPAVAIYRRFGLAQRGLQVRHFRGVVQRRRARTAVAAVPGGTSSEPPSWEELERKTRAAINERLNAGDIKVYEAVSVVTAAFKRREVAIKEEADARAAERHEAWADELRAKQSKALEQVRESAELTAEQLEEIRKKVLGI